MAPSYELPMFSRGDSPTEPDSHGPGDNTDEMAELEATYRDSTIHAGPEVEEFAAALDKYTVSRAPAAEKRAQIFKLVDHYHTYTRQRVNTLRSRQSRSKSSRARGWQAAPGGSSSGQESNEMDLDEGDDDSNPSVGHEDMQKLEEEAQTWDLLRRILPLRYRDSSAPSRNKPATEDPRGPRKRYWNDFILTDSVAKERKIVLEWLQTSASYGPPIDDVVSVLQQNADRGDILVHGWLHTRHKIKLQKSVNAYQGVLDPGDPGLAGSHLSSNTLITQLDPDAMTRQRRKLELQDESFERAIWLGCYEMLRRGRSMAEIRDWCSERTESWRAATISKLPLSSMGDENMDDFEPRSVILWRRMCFATARDGGTSDFERAVYGLLSGDVPSVEKVSKTWDDFLFAHYNALLRTQFDSYLIKQGGPDMMSIVQSFPVFNAVQQHGDPATAGKRLVATLETDNRTKAEALTPAKALQAAIVANDLDKHLYQQGLVLSKHANHKEKSNLIPDYGIPPPERTDKFFDLSDHDGLRILAHVLIVISTLDRLSGFSKDDGSFAALQIRHRVQEHIIAAYASFLRLADLEVVVPLYCSKLMGPRVYENLARNLIQIEDHDARAHQLSIMKKLGLDIAEFGRVQARICLEDVNESRATCEANGNFSILQNGPPTLKYGRIVKPDFFGEDAEFVDREDELIIRSLEWLMMIPEQFGETCAYATRVYKYFLKRMRLRAARALSSRIPVKEIVQSKTDFQFSASTEDGDTSWFDDFKAVDVSSEFLEDSNLTGEDLIKKVKTLFELECLVRALDSMETLSSLAEISREGSNTSREMWQRASEEIRVVKACMKPVLRLWLLPFDPEKEADVKTLREAYIPETVLAYVSSLHFVGTSLSRDNLLECMNLAAVIAEQYSDVSYLFMQGGRMKELVDAFASCSKALAISTAEKKGAQMSSKKFREMGWSRELWSIKP